MNIFAGNKAAKAANHAYRLHLDGNKLLEAGKVEQARQKHDEALKCYEEAYAAGLDRVGMLMSYGVLLMREGDFAKAKEVFLRVHYKRGLSDEDRFDLRVNYAVCLWRLGKLDEGIQTLWRASEYAKTTLVYTTLGMFLALKADQTGDFSQAIAFNNEAYEYDDEDAAILDNIGYLHMVMCAHARADGQADKSAAERKKAYEYLTRAHKLRPRQVTTLYYLAKMLFEDGQIERAGQFIDAALEGNFSAICPVSREDAQALKDALAAREAQGGEA